MNAVTTIKPLLNHYTDMQVVCEVRTGELIVSYKGEWYELVDNGGEIVVTKINSGFIGEFPTTWFETELDGHTLINRLLSVLNGEPIDYRFRAQSQVIAVYN